MREAMLRFQERKALCAQAANVDFIDIDALSPTAGAWLMAHGSALIKGSRERIKFQQTRTAFALHGGVSSRAWFRNLSVGANTS